MKLQVRAAWYLGNGGQDAAIATALVIGSENNGQKYIMYICCAHTEEKWGLILNATEFRALLKPKTYQSNLKS